MDDEAGSGRLRSFVLGGVLGASAAIAAIRQLSPRPHRRPTPAGLMAFEAAPCYRETLEREELEVGAARRGPA